MALADILKTIFAKAQSSRSIEYIFTLLRVEGFTDGLDPIIALERRLAAHGETGQEAATARYCSLALSREPLELIANLLRVGEGREYLPAPFHHLWRGSLLKWEAPSYPEIVRDLLAKVSAAGHGELAEHISRAYSEEALGGCEAQPTGSPEVIIDALGALKALLSALLSAYSEARRIATAASHFQKLPRFEVLELLTNDEGALYGLKMHFSNGATSVFIRRPESTECVNMSPGVDGVRFYIGDLDALRDEWRVGEKRLYEIGLPGRYNTLGEWKPLIYPGKAENLQREAMTFSDDPDVQGAFFYMLCTGHRVIEFAVRATIELPLEHVSIGDRLHLSKCQPADAAQTWVVYDGTYDVEVVEAEYIRAVIASIGVALNRFMFAYGGVVEWRVKYQVQAATTAIAVPSENDLQVFDDLLKKFPTSAEVIVLDAAVDWFNRGTASRNVFTGFLCYYIAIESVVNSIAEGVSSFGIEYEAERPAERRAGRAACVHQKHEELYADDPVGFVSEAYFQCVQGVTERARRVTRAVFGQDHPYVDALFTKDRASGNEALSSLRGQIAHGQLTLASREDEAVVRRRLPEIAEIAREFLTRLGLGLREGEVMPMWSGHFKAGWSMTDPRAVMVASREEMFPTKDWRIRPEWCG